MSQMTSLDGEYVILGRKGTDSGNIFVPYGTGAQFSANFTGGPGRQDVEFIDGLRFAVQSEFPLRMNVDLKYPLDEKDIPEGMMSLSMGTLKQAVETLADFTPDAYAWVVNTTGRVELTAPPIPAVPANGTLVPVNGTLTPVNGTLTSANATVVPLGPPLNALPAPVNSAKPFTFASPRRRQLAPAAAAPQPIAQPQPNAPGSPNLPAGNPTATLKPAAPAPPPPAAPPVAPNPPAIPGVPGSPPAPAPPTAPPEGDGIVTAAMIDFPLNLDAVRQLMRTNPGQNNANPAAALSDPQLLSTLRFTVGRRPTGAEPNSPFDVVPTAAGPGLTPNTGNTGAAADAQSLQLVNGRLVFQGVTQLDGEYVILVPMDSAMTAKIVAAKAGLIKESSGSRARAGTAMGALAVAVWCIFLS